MALHLTVRRCLIANVAGLHHHLFLVVFAFLPSTPTFPSPLAFHLYYDSSNCWSAFNVCVFFLILTWNMHLLHCYILWFPIQSKTYSKTSIWILLSRSFLSLIYSLFLWLSWLTWLHSSNLDFTILWLDKKCHNFIGYLGCPESGVIDSCGPSCGFWELNPGTLQIQCPYQLSHLCMNFLKNILLV